MTKHTILFLAANPLGTDRLALDEEARAIQVELERSGHRDQFELVTRWAARPLDLLRELRKLKPTVVHFSGRGGQSAAGEQPAGRDPQLDGSKQQHGLYFQGPDGQAQLVSTAALEETFGAAGASVKLVVLNACYSEVHAVALLTFVDCVVGMSSSIRDDVARNFAIGFYGGIGERESVEAAYKQGRAAIRLEGLPDNERPQLKVRDCINAKLFFLAEVRPDSTTADMISTNVPNLDEAQIPQHRPDADPDRIRLSNMTQSATSTARPQHFIVPRIVRASIMAGASIALVVLLLLIQITIPDAKIAAPTATEPPPPSTTQVVVPATESPDEKPRCRSQDSDFWDETVRGPSTVVSSMTYGALLYAKCLEGPCTVEIVNHGTSIRRFPLAKDQEWTGYQKLLGDELQVVHGLSQLMYCTQKSPAPAAELKSALATTESRPATAKIVAPAMESPAGKTRCRTQGSDFWDETVRGPSTVMSSTSYGALLYAKCLEGPCAVEIVNHGTSIRRFPLAKGQEWKGYQRLFGDELQVVRGLSRLLYCQQVMRKRPMDGSVEITENPFKAPVNDDSREHHQNGRSSCSDQPMFGSVISDQCY